MARLRLAMTTMTMAKTMLNHDDDYNEGKGVTLVFPVVVVIAIVHRASNVNQQATSARRGVLKVAPQPAPLCATAHTSTPAAVAALLRLRNRGACL